MFSTLPLHITPSALTEIKRITDQKKIPLEYGLRLGMKGSGCSGTSFIIGFDTRKDQDQVFELEGVAIYIEKKHLMYLVGLEVDFVEKETERGFVFNGN